MTDQRGGHGHELGRTLVVIPTYNERDNLEPLLDRLHNTLPLGHALVVDDDSPDGTGKLAERLAEADERISVLHRTAKEGLGTAYTAGFRWALDRDYGVIVEMDADGSHAPEDLPRLLDALTDHHTGSGTGADLAIGSRYVPGGAVQNWAWHRQLLSRCANLYANVALGAGISDITAGYRAYRRRVLESIDLDTVASQGYCFQIDLAWRTRQAGFRVSEVPITFTEREHGQSKMSGTIVREALIRVAAWGGRHRLAQLRDGARQVSGSRR